jgi:glycosyltransferase involved in cell wall biosynthesis
LFKDEDPEVIYTDAAFLDHGEKHAYTLAQVPYHFGKKHFVKYIFGKIPEWRNNFSGLWLTRNSPKQVEIVYAFVYSLNCLRYAYWIAKKKKARFIAHIADHNKDFESPEATSILSKSDPLVTISRPMKSLFQSTMKDSDILVIHNGPEESCFQVSNAQNLKAMKNDRFTIIFLGGLFEHLHSDSIEDVIHAVVQLRQKYPQVEFHMYGQRVPKTFLDEYLNRDGIEHHGLILPLEKKYEIMKKADCFIVPSSFNITLNRYYRFSFPTKLMELLATGKPTLVYGRSDTSTFELMQKHDFDTCICNRSVSNLVAYFEDLIGKQVGNDKISISRQSIIREKFHADCMRAKLRNILKK